MAPPKSVPLLIAEGSALLRDGLASICASQGRFNPIDFAADGEHAWEFIRVHNPPVAILALQLGGLHTLEIVRRIRDHSLPTRPVVLSHRRDRKTVLEVLRGGAHGILLHDSTGRHLLDCLQLIQTGGIYVSPEVDIQGLFSSPRGAADGDPLALLSAREFQVFHLLVDGTRPKQIANRLGLSPKTVDTYRSNLMKKLGIHDVPGLVRFALQERLIDS